eukprot:362965-Chlamydomonas_euryale.AAC.6
MTSRMKLTSPRSAASCKFFGSCTADRLSKMGYLAAHQAVRQPAAAGVSTQPKADSQVQRRGSATRHAQVERASMAACCALHCPWSVPAVSLECPWRAVAAPGAP